MKSMEEALTLNFNEYVLFCFVLFYFCAWFVTFMHTTPMLTHQ